MIKNNGAVRLVLVTECDKQLMIIYTQQHTRLLVTVFSDVCLKATDIKNDQDKISEQIFLRSILKTNNNNNYTPHPVCNTF